jgi:ribonuclease HII
VTYVIGSDECGYGAWAGPLVVCAVAVPADWVPPPGLGDSKKLKANGTLDAVYRQLFDRVPSCLICCNSGVIDTFGVQGCLLEAHTSVIQELLQRFPDADVVVDGTLRLPRLPRATSVPKADGLYPAVMAASVIGKYNRDALMRELHAELPFYSWDINAGYGGNKAHAAGLAAHGVSRYHRRSYAPIRKLLEGT